MYVHYNMQDFREDLNFERSQLLLVETRITSSASYAPRALINAPRPRGLDHVIRVPKQRTLSLSP